MLLSLRLFSVPQSYRPLLLSKNLTFKMFSSRLVPQRTTNIGMINISNIQRRLYSIKHKTNDILITPERILNKPKDINFSISERASCRLNEIYSNTKEILQIKVESGGCHGYQYNLKLVPDIKDTLAWEDSERKGQNKEINDDEFAEFDDWSPTKNVLYILPNNKGKILVDKMSLKILNGTTLIYSTELIGSSFKLINGKLKSKCGCGSSFDLEE